MKEIFFKIAVIEYTKEKIFIFLDSLDEGYYPGRQIILRNGVLEFYDDETLSIYGIKREFEIIMNKEDFEDDHEFLDKFCPGELTTYKKVTRSIKTFFKKEEKEVRCFKDGGWTTLKKGKDFRLTIIKGDVTITIGGINKLHE